MSIIWRGAGIFVIIALVISAWLTGYAFEEPGIRNLDYLKWVLLWAGIPVTLVGLALFPLQKDEAGKWRYIGNHDLFWIPMFVWGVGLLGFSVKYFVTSPVEEVNPYAEFMAEMAADSAANATPVRTLADDYPNNHGRIKENEQVVKLYNPTEENIEIQFTDDQGIAEEMKGIVEPLSSVFLQVAASDYTLKFGDITRKISIKPSTTLENQDRDEVWFVLGNNTDLLVVDATATCDPDLKTREDLKAIDFTNAVYKRYDGSKPIEMYIKAGNTYMRMREPYYSLPIEISEEEQIFSVIPIPKSVKTSDAYIDDFLASICFKTEGVKVF